MRSPPLVFIHIHKTAGTSLIEWLQRSYPLTCTLHNCSDLEGLARTRLASLYRSQFIRGHFGCAALDYLPHPVSLILLLRDPVERVLSHYHHHCNDSTDSFAQFFDAANRISLPTYLRHPCFIEFVDNLQTRELGVPGSIGNGVYRPVFAHLTQAQKAQSLDRAKRLIDTAQVVGVTEAFDQFMRLMCTTFPVLYDSSLPHYRQRRATLDVTEEIRGEIAERNTFDVELYAHAKQRMDYLLQEQAATHCPEEQCGWEKLSPAYFRSLVKQPLQTSYSWTAARSAVAQGWQEIVSRPASKAYPAHRWSGPTEKSVIHTPLLPGHRYRIDVRILRFVSALPRPSLQLELNGLLVTLTLNRSRHKNEVGYRFAGETDTVPIAANHPGVWISFKNEAMQSFVEVNPADSDDRMRGFALTRMNLQALTH